MIKNPGQSTQGLLKISALFRLSNIIVLPLSVVSTESPDGLALSQQRVVQLQREIRSETVFGITENQRYLRRLCVVSQLYNAQPQLRLRVRFQSNGR